MNRHALPSFLLFFLLPAIVLMAQEETPYLPFGKIQEEWLSMERHPSFPEAEAVILYDFGMINFDRFVQTPSINYEYRRVIKVQGDQTADFKEIPIIYDPGKEVISDIDGYTHAYNAEGEAIRFRISRRRLREEKLPDGRRIRIVEFPVVRKGNLLELRYVLRARPSQYRQLRPFEFQQTLPVVHSELHAFIPQSYTYQILLAGDIRRLQRISETFSNDQLRQSPIARSLPFSSQERVNLMEGSFLGGFGRHEIFVIDSLPALVEESFSPTRRDFIPAVRFELQENRLSGGNNPNLFDSWIDLNDKTQKRFGARRLKAHKREIHQLANRLVAQDRGQAAKVRNIYYWVQDNIKWDGEYELSSKRLDKILQNQEGNGTEINLLLLHLLQQADIKAEPVLISTVDNGLVRTYAPSLNQFNHLIVSARIQGLEVLLDGLGEARQLGILPEKDLTESGFLLDQQGGRWVPLRSQNRLVRHTYSRFRLDEGGELSGQMFVSNQDYSAVLEQERLKEAGGEEQYLRRHVLSGLSGVELANPAVNRPNQPEEPLIFSVDLRTDDFVQHAGDVLFVNPLMTKKVTENPFPEIRRTTPMDLTFPLREAHMLGLRLPDGFELAQVPEPIRVVLPNEAGSFTYNVISMDSIIHISSTIYLNKTIFLPEEYDAVRNFFEYIVNKHEEDLVLRRVAMKEEE